MESKYLMDRIYDLEQLLPLLPAELVRQDLSRLVISVLESVSKARGMGNLNRTLLARSRGHVAATPVSALEVDFVTGLSRLRTYWESVLVGPRSEFDRALGLGAGAPVLDSKEHLDGVSEAASPRDYAERLIIYELKKIIRAVNAAALYESPIEKALTQYKLGLEIMAPDNIKELLRKDELRLQKELCKFLLERGIFAVGTKFARAETGLLALLPDEGTIIEAKVYKDAARATEKAIKGNFVQLQNTMRRSPTRTRGILVIYNFSPTCISAPRQWINGRFWFLPINLQEQPPSHRNRSLLIEPADGGDGIRVANVKAPPER